MNESSLLRLSLLAGIGDSSTFNSNLVKLIKVVLYDSEISCLTSDEIRSKIAASYDLEFTNEEIEKSIKTKGGGICKEERSHVSKTKYGQYCEKENAYYLEAKAIQKLKDYEESFSLNNITREFLEQNNVVNYTTEEFEEILCSFLYNSFNTNRQALLNIINHNYEGCLSDSKLVKEEDKTYINDFLNWNNKEKDEYIYNCISYCVDYCILTVKKDYASFVNLFKGKVFYLDANVIFRMMGLNNEERKLVINSFINKSKNNGIEIKYTNFTFDEIYRTIENHVKVIASLSKGKELEPVEQIEKYTIPFRNLDFFRLYERWCKQEGNNFDDFQEFENSVKKSIHEIISKFVRVDLIDNQFTSNKDLFENLRDSLWDYKIQNKGYCTKFSAGVDVNNFLHIAELRKVSKGTSFLDINDYLISTDANLCEWGKSVMPGTIPVAVLPSVWHSLILKFKGRTENDYRAFSSFLNLRFRIIAEGFDKRKPRILSMVHNLNEPLEVRKKILDEVYINLQEKYVSENNVELIVQDAEKTIVDKEKEEYLGAKRPELIEVGRQNAFEDIASKDAERILNRRKDIINFLNAIKNPMGIAFLLGLIALFFLKGLAQLELSLKKTIVGIDVINWVCLIDIVFSSIGSCVVDPIIRRLNEKSFHDVKKEQLEKLLKKYQVTVNSSK